MDETQNPYKSPTDDRVEAAPIKSKAGLFFLGGVAVALISGLAMLVVGYLVPADADDFDTIRW